MKLFQFDVPCSIRSTQFFDFTLDHARNYNAPHFGYLISWKRYGLYGSYHQMNSLVNWTPLWTYKRLPDIWFGCKRFARWSELFDVWQLVLVVAVAPTQKFNRSSSQRCTQHVHIDSIGIFKWIQTDARFTRIVSSC